MRAPCNATHTAGGPSPRTATPARCYSQTCTQGRPTRKSCIAKATLSTETCRCLRSSSTRPSTWPRGYLTSLGPVAAVSVKPRNSPQLCPSVTVYAQQPTSMAVGGSFAPEGTIKEYWKCSFSSSSSSSFSSSSSVANNVRQARAHDLILVAQHEVHRNSPEKENNKPMKEPAKLRKPWPRPELIVHRTFKRPKYQ